MDLNKVLLVGRIGADPKNIATKTGTVMCKLRLATTEVRKKENELNENTSWHDILVFGKQATNCLNYLTKGREVWVEGKLDYKVRQVNGVNVKDTCILADTVGFLGKGSGTAKVAAPLQQQSDFDNDTPEFLSNVETVTSAVSGDSHINETHEVLMEQALQEE